jgi:hypothetical protein
MCSVTPAQCSGVHGGSTKLVSLMWPATTNSQTESTRCYITMRMLCIQAAGIAALVT